MGLNQKRWEKNQGRQSVPAGQSVQKPYWFVPPKILGYFGNSNKFRCVSAVNLFQADTRWMSIFFLIKFLVLTDLYLQIVGWHDSPNFSLLHHPHFVFLLNFNTLDDSRRPSLSLLLFILVYNSYLLLYILERWSPILF